MCEARKEKDAAAAGRAAEATAVTPSTPSIGSTLAPSTTTPQTPREGRAAAGAPRRRRLVPRAGRSRAWTRRCRRREPRAKPACTAPSHHGHNSTRVALTSNEPIGSPEDPDFFNDVDYVEDEDKDVTPGSRPSDTFYLLGIASRIASALLH